MAIEVGTATIDQLIIASPYEEPAEHWKYDRETRRFSRESGRRPAGYVRASEASKSFDDPGEFVELPLVNQIRPRVKAWREARSACFWAPFFLDIKANKW
jgi:type III restriction enzyme